MSTQQLEASVFRHIYFDQKWSLGSNWEDSKKQLRATFEAETRRIRKLKIKVKDQI